ncbi:hypothetical protein U1Q18_001271 [Sarracenia purpurea var. burkii]
MRPNRFTYSPLLRYGSESLEFCGTELVHTQIMKSGFERYPVVRTAMISGCAKLGKMGNVLLLLDEMPERDIPSWSAVIAGRILNGLFSEAIPLIRVSPSPGRGAELWSGRVPELCVRFDCRALRFYPNLGAVSADQGAELGLADLLPTGMLFADLFGVNLEDLAGAVNDGVANALFLWLNAGRYVAYFLWFLRLMWPFALMLWWLLPLRRPLSKRTRTCIVFLLHQTILDLL